MGGRARSFALRIALDGGVGVAYCLAAWPAVHYTLPIPVAPVWPSAGVAMAGALWRGASVWPWIFGASFLVNVYGFPRGRPLPGWLLITLFAGIAAGNTAAVFGARRYLTRRSRIRSLSSTVRGTFRFFVASLVSSAFAALIGAACLSMGAPATPAWAYWLTFCMGSTAGCLIVAPAMLMWLTEGGPRGWRPARVAEYLGLLVLLLSATWIAFSGLTVPDRPNYPLAFLLVPFLVWSAVRFKPRESATAVALAAIFATISTGQGGGPYWVGELKASLLVAQAHVIVWAATFTLLAASIAERRRLLERVQAARSRLEIRVSERTALVEQQAEQLRVLASRLAGAAQRERRRIAYVLYEDLQQLLVSARMRLARLIRSAKGPGRELPGEPWRDLDDLLKRSIVTSRDLSVQLVPPILDVGGLNAGLFWLTRRMEEAHGLKVEVSCETSVDPLDDEVRITLFEAAHELLLNVVRHSGASRARVSCCVSPSDSLRLEVSDEGGGFDLATLQDAGRAGRFGLFSLRERLRAIGGMLQIESKPGAGTRVTLTMPRSGRASLGQQQAAGST